MTVIANESVKLPNQAQCGEMRSIQLALNLALVPGASDCELGEHAVSIYAVSFAMA